jgi:phospholipid/cholesterol/gamma-HCH transport system substrate-binding protein
MSPYRRNVLVGFTVMGALVLLSIMLIKFGGTTVALMRRGDQVRVQFTSDRADGLADGAQVLYRGVNVGRVTSVRRDDNNVDVIIDTLIANDLPGNVTGSIRTVSLVSGIAAVELELTGGVDAKPQGKLTDGTKLTALYVGADLIPASITTELSSAGDLIKGLNGYVNDPAIHQDLQSSLQNIHHITDNLQHTAVNVDHFSDRLDKMGDEANATLTDAHATVKSTQADVEKITRQIDDRMLQISKSLDSFQSISAKIDKGQGTAGLLLNDPKLYQSLVANSQMLNSTIADLKRLVEQWEQEGVSFKLK